MDLQTLAQRPEVERDDQWELRFLDALLASNVQLEADEPQVGPDGWPYLKVRTSPEASEPFVRVVRWLAGRGFGCVVNAHKMMPDYVFTYGMIWNYVETQRFISPVNAPEGEVQWGPETLFGAPTEKYLPLYVREVLREFLKAQGHSDVRLLVATSPDFTQTDLILATESLSDLDTHARQKALAQDLGWFLPMHYSLVFAPHKGLPAFVPL